MKTSNKNKAFRGDIVKKVVIAAQAEATSGDNAMPIQFQSSRERTAVLTGEDCSTYGRGLEYLRDADFYASAGKAVKSKLRL